MRWNNLTSCESPAPCLLASRPFLLFFLPLSLIAVISSVFCFFGGDNNTELWFLVHWLWLCMFCCSLSLSSESVWLKWHSFDFVKLCQLHHLIPHLPPACWLRSSLQSSGLWPEVCRFSFSAALMGQQSLRETELGLRPNLSESQEWVFLSHSSFSLLWSFNV